MATKRITKKGKNSINRHIPIKGRSIVSERKISPKNISENEEYKTIKKFSVNGKSYMDAMTKFLYGKYKNILLNAAVISDNFYVYGKRVFNINSIEKAGHGSFDYILSKDNKIYALFGYIHINKRGIWYINAKLDKKI